MGTGTCCALGSVQRWRCLGFSGRGRILVSAGSLAWLARLIYSSHVAFSSVDCRGADEFERLTTNLIGRRRAAMVVGACVAELAQTRKPVAADVIPPPGSGTCVGCLGVVDQLLSRCRGDLTGCVSSQDDRPEVFEAPWQLPLQLDRLKNDDPSEDVSRQMKQLQKAVAAAGGQNLQVGEDGRYLRAEFLVDLPFLGKDADDCEWYFTPRDTIVQFRAERRSGRADFGANRQRLEEIRQRLNWEILPVIRNRQRAFFFGESPLDKFGPALYDQLRPGAEPTPDEAETLSRQGKDAKAERAWALRDTFANDDLGYENANGVLDAASRDFLRALCDPKLQICE